jgi:ribonuclease HI
MNIEVYTDGSYNSKENIGGYGVFIKFIKDDNSINYKRLYGTLDPGKNINRVELFAFVKAFNYLIDFNFNKFPTKFITDSKYIYHFTEDSNNNLPKVKSNMDLWNIYSSNCNLFKNYTIELVKDDSENHGNKVAHYLSKKYIYDKSK